MKNEKAFGSWKKLLLLVVLLTAVVTAETTEKPNGPPVTKEEQKELDKVLAIVNDINKKCGLVQDSETAENVEFTCIYKENGYDVTLNDYYKKMTPEIRKAFIESTFSVFNNPIWDEKIIDLSVRMHNLADNILSIIPKMDLFKKLLENGTLDVIDAYEYIVFSLDSVFSGNNAIGESFRQASLNDTYLKLRKFQDDFLEKPLSSHPSFNDYKKMEKHIFDYKEIQMEYYWDKESASVSRTVFVQYDVTDLLEYDYQFKKIVFEFMKGAEEKNPEKRKKMMNINSYNYQFKKSHSEGYSEEEREEILHVNSLGFKREDRNLNATYNKYVLNTKFELFFTDSYLPEDFSKLLEDYINKYHLSKPRTDDEFFNMFTPKHGTYGVYPSFLFVLGDYLIQKEKSTPRDVDTDTKERFDQKIYRFSDHVNDFITYRRNLVAYRDIFFKLMEEYLKKKKVWDAPDVQENFDLLKGYFVKHYMKDWTDDFKDYDNLKLSEEEKYLLSYPTKKKK